MSTISIVTPSYNQGKFIDATISSILGQNCEHLEYVVIDGGSTDNSVEIIRKHESKLHYWVSEPDTGQYAAVNKGFARTTGEIMAWLNSDDLYLPWALETVSAIFEKYPEIEWLTTSTPASVDARGNLIKMTPVYGFTTKGFWRGDNLPVRGTYGTCFIQQESTFWRRSLWERAGGHLEEGLKYAADFELWARFFKKTNLYAVDIPLGGFRCHGDQKTALAFNEYLDEARKVFSEHGGARQWSLRQGLRVKLRTFLPIAVREAAFRYGLMEPAYVVTFNNMTEEWMVTRA
jgi:glycosyltransferase involved in cell wall biosynthesis